MSWECWNFRPADAPCVSNCVLIVKKRGNAMAKAFSVLSWNVKHFGATNKKKNKPKKPIKPIIPGDSKFKRIVHPPHNHSSESRNRFYHQLSAASILRHPNSRRNTENGPLNAESNQTMAHRPIRRQAPLPRTPTGHSPTSEFSPRYRRLPPPSDPSPAIQRIRPPGRNPSRPAAAIAPAESSAA